MERTWRTWRSADQRPVKDYVQNLLQIVIVENAVEAMHLILP